MSENAASEVRGTAYIELRISGRYILSEVLDSWTPEEIQELHEGEAAAELALKDQLASAVCFQPHDLGIEYFELNLDA